MSLYEELKWRNLIKDVSDEELAKKLLNKKGVKFYCGFDPTGKSLTVGHLVQIVRMKLLLNYGHIPVVLIGGATGLIGDPRETSERKLLTLDESLENATLIKKQIGKYLPDDKVIYVNNNDWISKIDMITFLRDYGKYFNINYMLAKETVQSRLSTGISYTEFSYMLIQAIDYLHLFEKENVQIQFGGSDQWGNITTGLELIRKKHGNVDALGLSSPLLLKADGQKFGKSESGAIWLDENLTSPYEVYQYFLNTADQDISRYLRTLTLLSKDEIIRLENETNINPDKRIAQRKLAEEVTTFIHGKDALDDAINVTNSLFSGDFKTLKENDFLTLKKVLITVDVEKEINIIDALKSLKLAESNRQAREFINSGSISVNGVKISDETFIISKNESFYDKYVIIRRGKKKNGLILIK